MKDSSAETAGGRGVWESGSQPATIARTTGLVGRPLRFNHAGGERKSSSDDDMYRAAHHCNCTSTLFGDFTSRRHPTNPPPPPPPPAPPTPHTKKCANSSETSRVLFSKSARRITQHFRPCVLWEKVYFFCTPATHTFIKLRMPYNSHLNPEVRVFTVFRVFTYREINCFLVSVFYHKF